MSAPYVITKGTMSIPVGNTASVGSTQFYTTTSSITGVLGKYHNRVLTEDLINEIVDERVKEILKLVADRIGGDIGDAIKGVLETKDLVEKIDKGDVRGNSHSTI